MIRARFVKVLTGSDNEKDYRYAGFIRDGEFHYGGERSKIAAGAPSLDAFAWFMLNLGSEQISVWHEGSCSRCNRKLTTPQSIERGLGPTCWERAGA